MKHHAAVLGYILVYTTLTIFDVVCQSSSSTLSPTTEYTSTTARPTRAPFNQESSIRRRIITNSSLHSQTTAPVDKSTGETRVNISFTVFGLTRVEGIPHQMNLDVVLCLDWQHSKLRWDPKAYNNQSWVTASYWRVWTPKIMYYYRKTEKFGTEKRNVVVHSSGRCYWCYSLRLVMSCDDYSNYVSGCHAYVKLFGYPTSRGKFDQIRSSLSHRLKTSVPHQISRLYIEHNRPEAYAAQIMTSDEVTVSVTFSREHPLDFARLTWPMLCIMVTTLLAGGISTRKRDGNSPDPFSGTGSSMRPHPSGGHGLSGQNYSSALYDLFSLRVSLGVFTAFVCCLSTGDHSVHPRLANEAYLSWLLSVLLSLAIVLLLEMSYPLLQARFGYSSMFSYFTKGNQLLWHIARVAFVVGVVLIVLVI